MDKEKTLSVKQTRKDAPDEMPGVAVRVSGCLRVNVPRVLCAATCPSQPMECLPSHWEGIQWMSGLFHKASAAEEKRQNQKERNGEGTRNGRCWLEEGRQERRRKRK